MTGKSRALEEWVTDQLRAYFQREAGTGEPTPSTELTGLTQLHSLLSWERRGPEDWLPEGDVYPFIDHPELLTRVKTMLD